MSIRDLRTNKVEVVWTEPLMDPDAHLQHFFDTLACSLNFKTTEMQGTIAPTDARFRGDLRLHEEGKSDEAEIEKNEIEM